MPAPRSLRDLARWFSSIMGRKWPATAVLIGCLLLVVAAWTFIELAEDVVEGDTRQFDAWVIDLVRHGDGTAAHSQPLGPGWLVTAALDITALGSAAVLLLVIALVAASLALRRKYRAMWLVLIATIMGQVINSALKAIFARERPDAHLHLVEVSTASFPSGHAMMSAVTYLTLGALLASIETRKRMKAFALGAALTLTALVGVTRVYLGVHYATDVLAGWAAGLAWALACWIVAQWLKNRGMLRQSGAVRGDS